MEQNKASYRQIMKATSLFGGVKVFEILIRIVRSKIIALLIGPEGMGIAGLFTSSTDMISGITNFGLGISAVRNIAEANETENKSRISMVITIFRRLVWITGILGAVVTIILSPWLSEITFGNEDYTVAFIWLSSTLLFKQLTSGQNVLLQGMRKLNYLAKANLIGSIVGLFISVPIYYYYRIEGIVPALIITSIFSFIIARYFSEKVVVQSVKVTREEMNAVSKDMLRMGIMLSLSSLITLGTSFILRIFISNTGGVDDVGLFTAGFAIINTYVGLVFTAMGTDFYPRLSGVANSYKKTTLLINQQAEIGVLILAPILTIFFIFINWIVIILYSTKFLPASEMIQWAALGMYFKVVSWCIAYLLLAKGATKLYFWTELSANAYTLLLNVIGYKLLGLEGLGISYMLGYMLYLLQIYFVCKIKYRFNFNIEFFKIFVFQFITGTICFFIVKFFQAPWSYIIGIPFICISIWYSFYELDARLGLRSIIEKYSKKNIENGPK